MRVNGELFALVNTLINGLSLWLAARLMGVAVTRGRHLAYAALCGAAYGTAAFLPGFSFLRSLPFLLLATLLMARLLFPGLRVMLVLKAAVMILLTGLALGGVMNWLTAQGIPLWPAFLSLFLCLPGIVLLLDIKIKPSAGVTMVEIAFHGGGAGIEPIRLPAMLDTGNLLADPVTGLPVVVASFCALKPLLPGGWKPREFETLPPGFRLLRVQTAAGHGLMMCFRPSFIRVRSGGVWRDIHALVAIAPAGYGGAQALVPATVLNTSGYPEPPSAEFSEEGGAVPSAAQRNSAR